MLAQKYRNPEETIELLKSCYKRENKRVAMGFFLGSEYPNIRYKCYYDLPDSRPLTPSDFPIAPFLEDCEKLFEEHQQCPGDLMWTGTPFWGIPWIEAMLGCEIYYNKISHSITAAPVSSSIEPCDIPQFSEENPWVKKLIDFYQALENHSNGRYPIGTTRIRGLADLLAALLGAEEFIMQAYTDAERIRALLDKITPFYRSLMNKQIESIPLFYHGVGSFYYYNWAPSNTRWHQEDSCMLLSPDLYTRIIEPYDRLIFSDGNNICHFHSTGGFIPYKEVLRFSPLAVEMHLDTGGPRAKELYEIHSEILATTPLIIWGVFTEEDFKWIFTQLPPNGVILSVCVSSVQEAKDLWNTWM